MADQTPGKLEFRPRARIIRTIGDQLISGPEAAVIELVKNSYDADASYVAIKFHPPLHQGSGRISVTDDGHGMTLEDIRDKWMEPATISKVMTRTSPDRGRLMMGSKGIGRFAAAKLGKNMSLLSVSKQEGVRKEILIPNVDWTIFSEDIYLDDISIDYLEQETSAETGTTIEILELNESWNKAKLERLYLELRRLVPPLEQTNTRSDFSIFLDLSLCTSDTCGFDGHSIISQQGVREIGGKGGEDSEYEVLPFPLLTTCDYELKGHIDAMGEFAGTFQNRRAGQAEQDLKASFPIQEEEDSCGPIDIELYIFDRDADVIKETMRRAGMGNLTAAQARKVLDNIAGIAIYRSGFRMRPYGDAANDWLTLDRRRVQQPSLRIGHNQIAGFITVADQEASNLIERSSREGFEENASFDRLKGLALLLLSRIIEPKRYEFRARTGLSRARATGLEDIRKAARLERVRKALTQLDDQDRELVTKAIEAEAASLSSQLDDMEHRQRSLEAISTLGGIVREIIHEGTPEAMYLAEATETLSDLFPRLLSPGPLCEAAKKEFPPELLAMRESSDRLRDLFEALSPLAGGRRLTPKKFNPVNFIRHARAVFQGSNIPVNIHNPEGVSQLFGYSADLVTALSNLIRNSVYWLKELKASGPRVDIRLDKSGDDVLISVEDNGPGIPSEFRDSIFDVGFTLKEGGTGLGLNIAKEALARSGATINLDREFEEGTRFEIRFPRGEE